MSRRLRTVQARRLGGNRLECLFRSALAPTSGMQGKGRVPGRVALSLVAALSSREGQAKPVFGKYCAGPWGWGAGARNEAQA